MKKFDSVFCTVCGEIYDLTDPTFKELPLEACGECGGLHFINCSDDCNTGFMSYRHYLDTISITPRRLFGVLQKMIDSATFPNL